MNSEVSLFNFHSKEIHVIKKNGEPWFVTGDVCRALNLYMRTNGTPNVSKAALRLEPDELQVTSMDLNVGTRNVSCVSESGLYKLVMRSNKKEAKEFQNWVTQVVLPSIRKDGGYITGEEKVAMGEMSEDELLLKAFEVLQKKTERLTKERDKAQGIIDKHLKYLTVDE